MHDIVPGAALELRLVLHLNVTSRRHNVHLSRRRLCWSLCRRLVWGTLHCRPLIPHDLWRGAGLPDV